MRNKKFYFLIVVALIISNYVFSGATIKKRCGCTFWKRYVATAKTVKYNSYGQAISGCIQSDKGCSYATAVCDYYSGSSQVAHAYSYIGNSDVGGTISSWTTLSSVSSGLGYFKDSDYKEDIYGIRYPLKTQR